MPSLNSKCAVNRGIGKIFLRSYRMRLETQNGFRLKKIAQILSHTRKKFENRPFFTVLLAREVRVRPRVLKLCVAYAHAYLHYI